MQWTHEQSPIIQSKASKILVRAFAGTGKTTTLVGFAKANPTLRILYLCYNSSVGESREGQVPPQRSVQDRPQPGSCGVRHPVRPQEDEEPASD
ncbi:DNA helicase [Pseudomonas aeruginosa]|nr:DNA helicase [Pseudomonas aeruginosa]